MRRQVSLACLLLAASAPALCHADGKKVYDWKFFPGRTITFSTKVNQHVKKDLDGKSTGDIHHTITATYARTTHSVADGKAQMEMRTTTTRVEVEYGKAKAKWDSENKRLRKARSLPFIAPYAADYDRKVLFVMDIPGRAVSDVRFQPDNGARAVPPSAHPGVVQRTLQISRRLFPTTPVGVGDSWDWAIDIPIDQNHAIAWKGQRTLAAIEVVDGHRCAKLKSRRKGTIVTPQKGFEAKVKLVVAKESSTSWFDIDRGFMLKETSELTVKTTRELEIAGQGKKTETEERKLSTSFQIETVTK